MKTINLQFGNVESVDMSKIKDFIEDIKNEIKWILAGCPKPQPIPVKDEDERRKK